MKVLTTWPMQPNGAAICRRYWPAAPRLKLGDGGGATTGRTAEHDAAVLVVSVRAGDEHRAALIERSVCGTKAGKPVVHDEGLN